MGILEQLMEELAELEEFKSSRGNSPRSRVRRKHASPTGTPSSPYMHGPYGLFGVAGLSRDVISTRVDPTGLAGALPSFPSVETHPLYAYITGFQSATGTQPDPTTNPCGNAPIAGAIKNCLQTAQFGNRQFRTRELNIRNIGKKTNRGEFFDLRVLNDPLVEQLAVSPIFNGLGGNDQRLLGGQELLARFLEVGVAFQMDLGEQIYIGTGTGAEFAGLDILIGTNKYDALSGAACSSLNSDIKNFNYGIVTSQTNPSIVHVMTAMKRYTGHNGKRMHMGGVEQAWVMREDLFNEITDVWPVEYGSYRMAGFISDTNITMSLDGFDATRLRDEMREGRYLIIDGKKMPVIIDDFITEESNDTPGVNLGPGQFASDIYLVPLTVRNGLPVTFWEVFNYNNGELRADMALGHIDNGEFWTDGGNYLWHKQPPLNGCHVWQIGIEPRVRLLTPHLAGRILNVGYSPLQHTRDASPAGYYHLDGGVTTARPAPSLWSDWNLPS